MTTRIRAEKNYLDIYIDSLSSFQKNRKVF